MEQRLRRLQQAHRSSEPLAAGRAEERRRQSRGYLRRRHGRFGECGRCALGAGDPARTGGRRRRRRDGGRGGRRQRRREARKEEQEEQGGQEAEARGRDGRRAQGAQGGQAREEGGQGCEDRRLGVLRP